MRRALRVVVDGAASGRVLRLEEGLSFWGGFDPRDGRVIDRHHPQCGACLAGRVVLMPRTRGSGGTPGGVAEALRLGTGPAAFVLDEPDANIATGVLVAIALYGTRCPVLVAPAGEFAELPSSGNATIRSGGEWSGD